MTVRDIVREWLVRHGYDGLAGDECGCRLDHLMPWTGCGSDCVPGHLQHCGDCSLEGTDACPGAYEGDGCIVEDDTVAPPAETEDAQAGKNPPCWNK